MAEEKKNPLIGAFRTPALETTPPIAFSDVPGKAPTNSKTAPTIDTVALRKLIDEKRSDAPGKMPTDSKATQTAAPVSSGRHVNEKKPVEPDKVPIDGKMASTGGTADLAKPTGEKKPDKPDKTPAESKTAASTTTSGESADEKKPVDLDKLSSDPQAAAVTAPAESEAEKPLAGPVKPNDELSRSKDAAITYAENRAKGKAFMEDHNKQQEEGQGVAEKPIDREAKIPMGIVETDKVIMMDISQIHRFDGHPFKVVDDKDMLELTESIRQFGVMEPTVIIPRKEGGYEMVSGHRRQRACQLAGLTQMPVIIRRFDRDEATISMVDSNLKRENISPMEKARAYEMKLEAMKRKAGRRSKTDILAGDTPKRADEQLAEQVGESRATIQRFTRLTKLTPELQEMVDEKRLPVNTGADISYLKPDEQKKLADAIKREDKVPSGIQAAQLKEASKTGTLTPEKIEATVAPTPKEKDPELKVTFNNDELRTYFPDKRTTVGEVKRTIFEALELRARALERKAKQLSQGPPDKKKLEPAR